MARVFRDGTVISGQGGSGIYATPSGEPYRTQLIVPMQSGQSNIAGPRAIGFQKVDGKDWIVRCNPDGSSLKQLRQVSCNVIVGGTAEYAWSIMGNTFAQTSWGLVVKGALALWMTDDDALIVLMSYSTGRGVACYRKGNTNPDAPDWSVPDAVTLSRYPYPQLYALDADRVVWCDVHGNLATYGLPQPAPWLATTVSPFMVEHPDGSLWLGGIGGRDAVTVRPWNDASRGYVLGAGFGASGAGSYVCWALNGGENAAVSKLIDWAQPTVPLPGSSEPEPEPPTPPTPPTPEPPMPMPTFRMADCEMTREGGDIRAFPVTARVLDGCGFDNSTLRIPYDKAGQWPQVPWPFDPPTPIDGNQWIFVYRNGRWLAGVDEWLRPGQQEKGVDFYSGDGRFYARDRWGDLFQWKPTVGETIGVCVTTPCRAGMNPQARNERSNVVFLQFTSRDRAVVVGTEGGVVEPPTPEPPTPEPPQPPVPPVPGEPTNAQVLAAVNRLQADFDRVFK